MTCTDARQYLFAFLDNELDSALSLEVQQHIEHCPHCARECEIESEVRRQLAEKLRHAAEAPVFDESALVGILRSDAAVPLRERRPSRRYWMLGAGGSMVAAILLATTLFVTNRGDRVSLESLADALVDDFDHFVVESKPLQIVSADADEVSRWLTERTALAVRMPEVDLSVGALRGGRKCNINGRPAAFAVYELGNELASVVALQEPAEALASMRRVESDGHVHWIDRCRGHTVLACRRGELIYAVVSRLPVESISSLMPLSGG